MSNQPITRRTALRSLSAAGVFAATLGGFANKPSFANGVSPNPELEKTTERALNWLVKKQTRLGNWPHDTYPTAIASLAGTALICSGSTTTQGPYAKNIRRTVDYLVSKCRRNGLIGDPKRDNRYTCLLYTSPSPRDATLSRMPSSA